MLKTVKPNLFILIIACIILLFLISIILYTGIIGVDFGRHQDEDRLWNSVKSTIKTGVLLPGWYNYPSMCYWISLATSIPEIIKGFSIEVPWVRGDSRSEKIQAIVAKTLDKPYHLRLRIVFLTLTMLSIFWVFLLLRQMNVGIYGSFVGAAVLGGSWELGYHARWAAPDGLMMMFGVLAMLLLYKAVKQRNFGWLYGGAIMAGVCTGTKYPGGIMLFQVLLSIYFIKGKAIRYWTALGLFALTFLIITPGMVVEPLTFVRNIYCEIRHYSSDYFLYTVSPGIGHAKLIFNYLVFDVLSHHKYISFILFLLGCFGVVKLILDDWRIGLWMIFIPVMYFLYFFLQRVLIVRNLLFLFPFLALFVGLGFNYLGKLKWIALPSVLALLTINYLFLYNAGIDIRDGINPKEKLEKFLVSNRDKKYALTGTVASLINTDRYPQVKSVDEDFDFLIFYTGDYSWEEKCKILIPYRNNYTVVAGTYEVNINRYPTWVGSDRIVATPKIVAIETGLTKGGMPKHPLYLRKDLEPQGYNLTKGATK